ncbi:MAG: glycosyltransferase family 2 protein [Bryobacterales bacterium]|nr:glycosyltransferase family 2 protein [Bryobacterales bacterium]
MSGRSTTIIIPNYNGARHLSALWNSLAAQTRTPERVVLVDNGSTDSSTEHLPAFVELLALGHNHGFAAAVNRGIEAARSDYVAILNNDVVLDAEWLKNLEGALTSDEYHFACPLLISAHAVDLIDGAFDLLTRSGCAARALHNQHLDHPLANQPRTIHFPPMTAALFRRSVFDAVGPLNEMFGSYYEDVEWGLRAAVAGFAGRFVPEARATHIGSATLGAWSSHATYLISRNQLLLVASHYPDKLLRAWWWPILLGNLLYLLISLRHGQVLAALRGKTTALRRWGSIRRERNRTLEPLEAGGCTGKASLEREIVMQSEQAWLAAARYSDPGTFWKLYFHLCPVSEPPATETHPLP